MKARTNSFTLVSISMDETEADNLLYFLESKKSWEWDNFFNEGDSNDDCHTNSRLIRDLISALKDVVSVPGSNNA